MTPEFWKTKLAAFLHDSPSKAFDVASHELRAEAALRRLGLVDANNEPAGFDRTADHTAAAADRLPFPHWQASGVRCAYDSAHNPFRHPFSEVDPLRRNDVHFTPASAEEIEQRCQPPLFNTPPDWNDEEQWRAQFFAQWRFWRRNATEQHAGFAALPADTRIPDHTIWTHMGLVSAFAGAGPEPALLKFQLGPVQDFIAAARSTRDLWSGSFLLSWLMAAGLARLAREIGPDAVIFPNLWGQPLFDLRFRDGLWTQLRAADGSDDAWTSLEYTPKNFLTPNLPNVFLALVPGDRATDVARLVEEAIHAEWKELTRHVRAFAEPLFDLNDPTVATDALKRFDAQVSRHLDIAWQTTPFTGSAEALIESAEAWLPRDEPPDAPTQNGAVLRVRALVDHFTRTMPVEHRDPRFYVGGKDGPHEKLNNLGVAWSLAVALNGWQLDAARQTRLFDGLATGHGNWNRHTPHGAKDALDGRNLMLFGGSKGWLDQVHTLHPQWKNLFRHQDEVGAITLVKRTWHLAHLRDHWGIQPHGMPNTHDMASGINDVASYDLEERADTPKESDKGKYYAILAFDGDSIGRWISGANTPAFRTQLADHCHREGKLPPRRYFEQHGGRALLDLKRPLAPAYHLQFSEALSNFALHCAPKVVEGYRGRILYAGGDDVLAMVPANHALACADDLQRVFRGRAPAIGCGILELSPGFLSVHHDHDKRPIPLILPGPAATASVGIALAHFMQPLQEVVRAARAAERQAKRLDGKHAVAVRLLKRSGEIIHWSTRFDADTPTADDRENRGGLLAVQWILYAMGCRIGTLRDRSGNVRHEGGPQLLSAKFPHRLSELLEPYCNHGTQRDSDDFPADDVGEVFNRELDHALDRQTGKDWAATPPEERKETISRLREALLECFASTPSESSGDRFKTMTDLLATAAFLARQPDLAPRH